MIKITLLPNRPILIHNEGSSAICRCRQPRIKLAYAVASMPIADLEAKAAEVKLGERVTLEVAEK